LALYRSIERRFEELEKQLTSAQEDLKARLTAGATVEAGSLVAFLEKRPRRNVAWRKVSEDLADTVFGKGSGAQYCEEVLASTPATVTTSLIVR
jgi:hypothetical protein